MCAGKHGCVGRTVEGIVDGICQYDTVVDLTVLRLSLNMECGRTDRSQSLVSDSCSSTPVNPGSSCLLAVKDLGRVKLKKDRFDIEDLGEPEPHSEINR